MLVYNFTSRGCQLRPTLCRLDISEIKCPDSIYNVKRKDVEKIERSEGVLQLQLRSMTKMAQREVSSVQAFLPCDTMIHNDEKLLTKHNDNDGVEKRESSVRVFIMIAGFLTYGGLRC